MRETLEIYDKTLSQYHQPYNTTGKGRATCLHFKEMTELYGYRSNVEPVATCSSSGSSDKKGIVSSFCKVSDDFEFNNQNEHDTS